MTLLNASNEEKVSVASALRGMHKSLDTFGGVLDKDSLTLWFNVLGEYPVECILYSLWWWASERPEMPKPSQIKSCIEVDPINDREEKLMEGSFQLFYEKAKPRSNYLKYKRKNGLLQSQKTKQIEV